MTDSENKRRETEAAHPIVDESIVEPELRTKGQEPMTDQADLICELRAGARELDRQHVLSLAAGILHDAVNDGRADADAAADSGTTDTRLQAARVAAALGAARAAAYGSSDADPDWTGSGAR